jgi:hypothetical protein
VLPLLATQILWINLITDSGPALAMGVDPQTEDVMARPPRTLTERVIDVQMWANVLEVGAAMAVATRRADRRDPEPEPRPHRRLHGARLLPAVQLLQRALRDRERIPPTCSSIVGYGAPLHFPCSSRLR